MHCILSLFIFMISFVQFVLFYFDALINYKPHDVMKRKTYVYLVMSALFLLYSFADDTGIYIFGIILGYVNCLINNRHNVSISYFTLLFWMGFGMMSSVLGLYGRGFVYSVLNELHNRMEN